MSERDELLRRLAELGISVVLPDGSITEEWVLGSLNASAVLAEIERTYMLVPLPGCECEDCYPELTAAAGVPVPEGITSVTWGWGELSGDGS